MMFGLGNFGYYRNFKALEDFTDAQYEWALHYLTNSATLQEFKGIHLDVEHVKLFCNPTSEVTKLIGCKLEVDDPPKETHFLWLNKWWYTTEVLDLFKLPLLRQGAGIEFQLEDMEIAIGLFEFDRL